MYRFDAGTGTYRSYADENGNYDAPLQMYDDPTKASGPVIRVTGENGEGWQAVPTTQDFNGYTFSQKDKTILGDAYKNAAGDIRYYDPATDTIAGVAKAAPTTYDPNSLQTNYQGYKYFNTPGSDTYIPSTYWIDPATNKPTLYNAWDTNSPFNIEAPRKDGGFDTWMTENGWIAPLAIATAGVASGALGAGAGAAELAGPTYGELGITGVEGGLAGPTYAEMGYTGLNQGQAIAAADAASNGLTASEALKYTNQARQGLGIANTIAKLLGGSTSGKTGATGSTTGGINQQQLASLLNGGQQTNNFIGQIKGNQNPFFGLQNQTQAAQGTYDVSGSNLANALRKA
jgi:hypothetical protein